MKRKIKYKIRYQKRFQSLIEYGWFKKMIELGVGKVQEKISGCCDRLMNSGDDDCVEVSGTKV